MRSKDRLLVAFAISIALHEIVAGLIPASLAHRPTRETVTHAQVLHITLVPIATPAPLVQPPIPVARVAVVPVVKPRAIRNIEGRAGRHKLATRTQSLHAELARTHNSKPIWDAGAGVKTGGMLAQTGNGALGAGQSSAAAEPCGFVIFSDPHGSQFDPQTRGFWVDVRMSVHFADGSSQSLILDYPWYYPSEAANPWSDQNLKDPNFPTRFQPPPTAKRDAEPPLVQYVITHSTPEGLTLLHDCPSSLPNQRRVSSVQSTASGLTAIGQSRRES